MPVPVIQVRNIAFSYRSKEPIIEGVTFDVTDVESVAIMGASGIGKTTLCRLISGLLRPSIGEVLLHGSRVNSPSKKITVSFQDSACFPWLSVKQNLFFGLKNFPRDELREFETKALWVLEQVGLADKRDSLPRELSGGMLQRLSIARCLAVQPDVLVLDEPLSALDPLTKKTLKTLLRRLQSEMEFALVSVLHSMEDAFTMGDRVIVLGGRPAGVCLDFQIGQLGFQQFESAVIDSLQADWSPENPE